MAKQQMNEPPFPIEQIRPFLVNGLSEAQVRRVVEVATFADLRQNFPDRVGVGDLVDTLLQFTENRFLWRELLDWAAFANPTRYAATFGLGWEDSPAQVFSWYALRAENFTGRETILTDLLTALRPGAVVTLCGPGGIGKTALAMEAIWHLVGPTGASTDFPQPPFNSHLPHPKPLLPKDSLTHLVTYYLKVLEEANNQKGAAYCALAGEVPHLVALAHRCLTQGEEKLVTYLAWAVTDYLNYQGHRVEEIKLWQFALQVIRQQKDKKNEGNALGNLGLAYAALGEVEKAINHYQQALTIAREIGDKRGKGNHLANLGLACQDLGDLSQASLTINRPWQLPKPLKPNNWLAKPSLIWEGPIGIKVSPLSPEKQGTGLDKLKSPPIMNKLSSKIHRFVMFIVYNGSTNGGNVETVNGRLMKHSCILTFTHLP